MKDFLKGTSNKQLYKPISNRSRKGAPSEKSNAETDPEPTVHNFLMENSERSRRKSILEPIQESVYDQHQEQDPDDESREEEKSDDTTQSKINQAIERGLKGTEEVSSP